MLHDSTTRRAPLPMSKASCLPLRNLYLHRPDDLDVSTVEFLAPEHTIQRVAESTTLIEDIPKLSLAPRIEPYATDQRAMHANSVRIPCSRNWESIRLEALASLQWRRSFRGDARPQVPFNINPSTFSLRGSFVRSDQCLIPTYAFAWMCDHHASYALNGEEVSNTRITFLAKVS